MNKELLVYWSRDVVGKLSQPKIGQLAFEYDPQWVANNNPSISLSLPTDQSFDAEKATNFFGNLLPEGDFRKEVEKLFQASAQNDFSLLEQIGEDCAGALSIGKAYDDERGYYEKISDRQLLEILKTGGASGFRVKNATRLSLAGAQGKLPIAIRDGHISLPYCGAPSTHIMKFNRFDGQYPRLAENEFYLTKIANHIGLRAISVELRFHGKHVFLVSERYDRKLIENNWYEKIHQEDFCQALGHSAMIKYEKEGGASFADCIGLARKHLPLKLLTQMLDWLVFNIATGNSDAHSKNLSLLFAERNIELAPFYDLVCTRAYPHLDRHLAMAIGGNYDPDVIQPKHVESLARDITMTPRFVRSRFDFVLDRLPAAVIYAEKEVEALGISASQMNHIFTAVRKRVKKMTTTFKK